MLFKYACFISYCHGKEDLVKTFIEELKKALERHIDPYLDEDVYVDEGRLRGGDFYDEKLAEAICQSICMIVVYMPKYERHSYCLREYAAMELLEEKRLRLVEPVGPKRGLIIPIIFRGAEDLPPKIQSRRHYYDFSRFTLVSPEISKNPEYVAKIEDIARNIHDLYNIFKEAFEASGEDPCGDCTSFTLPPEGEVRPWREKAKSPVAPFPGRGEGR